MKIEDYKVGWICALATEMAAAACMLDERHDMFSQPATDDNNYTMGRIGQHNVVIACLPAGVTGVPSAARVAEQMRTTFTALRFGLMVGIGGGAPNEQHDIRLGDVVVSKPGDTSGGVIQYDFGKTVQEGRFVRTGSLNRPPDVLLSALNSLQARHMYEESQISNLMADSVRRYPLRQRACTYLGTDSDHLYHSHYDHPKGESTCGQCDNIELVKRQFRESDSPKVYYGLIASGNQVMRDGKTRERLQKELNVLCFEMEAAGLMDRFPCLVVRGICDYADSHKNKQWQDYAAAAAAAYTKELLNVIPSRQVASSQDANDLVGQQDMGYRLGLNLGDAPTIERSLFIGRVTELEKMKDVLQPGVISDTRKTLVLGGMGGVGKTQLAIAYAVKHRQSYTSVIWLNATSKATIKSSLRQVARLLLAPKMERQCDDDLVQGHVSTWLSERDNDQWLLIFDNYDEPEQYDITYYYPYTSHGSVIVTTRSPVRVSGEEMRVLPMLDETEGLTILEKRSGREGLRSDVNAQRLVRRLGGLPLALGTAGAFLKQSSVSCEEYVEQYEAKWQVVPRRPKGLPEYQGRTLYTTWDLSYTQIERQHTEAAQLLKFLAYLDHQQVWYELLSMGGGGDCPPWFQQVTGNRFAFEEAMGVLMDFCLVEARHGSGTYSLHVCVHDWTLNSLNKEIATSQYWLAFDCVAGCVGNIDWDMLSDVKHNGLVPHAVRLTHHRFQGVTSEAQGRLTETSTIAELLRQHEQYTAGEQMYVRVLAGEEKALGPNHTFTLDTVHSLGNLYKDQEKMVEAKEMYSRALVGYEKALGPNHTSTLGAVHCLGILYADQGKMVEAEKMYSQALAGFEKALGPNNTSTLNTINNLGNLYADQGKMVEAEKMYSRALAGFEKALGPNHTLTLSAVHCLGNLYANQGKMVEAEKMYSRALVGYEKALGPNHTSTLSVINCLGNLYKDQGKMVEAEKMYSQALAGFEKALGPNNTMTLSTVLNVGNWHAIYGQVAEMRSAYERALIGFEKSLGPAHLLTLDTKNNLGSLARRLKRPIESQELYERALAGFESLVGPGHHHTLATVNNLGNLYFETGEKVQAQRLYERAVTGYEKLLGPVHPSTLISLHNFAVLCKDFGKTDEANDMDHHASTELKAVWGVNHPELQRLESCECIDILI